MANLTVRNVPDAVHRALRVRAAQKGRSAEAEVRSILQETLIEKKPTKLGSLLVDIGRDVKLTDEELAALDDIRDKNPAHPVELE